MSDVFDILGIERPETPESSNESNNEKKKKKKLTGTMPKCPEGMHRELYALLNSDDNDYPPIFITDMEQGYKKNKAKLGMKHVGPWKWMPFTNSARKDGAVFYHWGRAEDEGEEYPYAKFNKVVPVPQYTDDEYVEHLQKKDWTRQETDHLFDLCQRFDLRFIVIQDRWDRSRFSNRSIEDLKERYCNVCNTLTKIRAVGNAEPKLIAYDADNERRRKKQLMKLYDRTQEQVEEEQILMNELCKIDKMKTNSDKKIQDLNLITAAGHSQSETKHLIKKGQSKNQNVNAANIKFADFKGSGVFCRSRKMKLPSSVGQKKSKAIQQMLKELDIGPNPIPTKDICTNFNELRSDMVLLYELSVDFANCESELQTLRHQMEALTLEKEKNNPDPSSSTPLLTASERKSMQ